MSARIYANWAAQLRTDIDAAERCIIITALSMHRKNPHVESLHSRLLDSVTDAASRGVDVQVALPVSCGQHPATAQNARTLQYLHGSGVKCHTIPAANLLHAKVTMLDDEVIWIGSGNWTRAAAHHNHELYARIECASQPLVFREYWTKLLKTIGGERAASWSS